ncbi:hypothetical protein [Phytohabitans aurantiacus]|nr:hypothetical protein [Phytohabitans aurantiacus]
MAQPRIRYEDGRPYTVPETLEELTGPTSGVVELLWPADTRSKRCARCGGCRRARSSLTG